MKAASFALLLVSCRGCESGLDVDALRNRAEVPAVAWAAVTAGRSREGAVGRADAERDEPATTTTPFEAASIAKTIIATCVLQLVEQNKLALDADVAAYVGFSARHPSGAITLRQLLTHTASIEDRAETRAPGELGSFLHDYFDAGAFFDAGPGTTTRYSNVGPALAAFAVERVSGVPFAEYARARVFVPLRMTRTGFGTPPASAAPHARRGAAFVKLPPPSHALYPAVDLFATAGDLGRFARAILRGGELDEVRILERTSVETMLDPEEPLGWQRRRFGGRLTFGHEGEDAGAATGMYLDRVSGRGAVVLANGDAFTSDDPARARALGTLIERLLVGD